MVGGSSNINVWRKSATNSLSVVIYRDIHEIYHLPLYRISLLTSSHWLLFYFVPGELLVYCH
jgi:hypothetical protein